MQKMTEERLREIEERQKAALQELFGLCDGSRKFTRCIPLQETDTDIVIDASLHDIPDLIQTVREQATLIEELQKVVDAVRDLEAMLPEDDGSDVAEETRLEIALFDALAAYDAYIAAPDTPAASGEGEPDVFFTALDAAVCIFDDIDKMHVGSTGWSLSEWWDIIDYRISIPRPLILTTNWGPDDEDMLAKFDESTISRLVGACEWIRLEGEDYRRTPEYRRRFQKGARTH